MKKQIIRKNAISNEWEHYVEKTNLNEGYWSPGLSGGDNQENLYNASQLPRVNKNGMLMSYNFFNYHTEYFDIINIEKEDETEFEELEVISMESMYGTPIANINGPYGSIINIPILFSSEGSTGGATSIAEYIWDFGDGDKSNEANPTHTYTKEGIYTISLQVSNEFGQSDINVTLAEILIEAPENYYPIVNINGPYTGKHGEVLSFSSEDSEAGTGLIVKYNWNFGDGNTSNLANPTHEYLLDAYEQQRIFNVSLTIENNLGYSSTETTTTTIKSTELIPVITVSTTGPYSGIVGQSIRFVASAVSTDGKIVNTKWEFGDGNIETRYLITNHAYTEPGIYLVKLTVEDILGNSDSANTTAMITIKNI